MLKNNQNISNDLLNAPINYDEIRKGVYSAKDNKAVGLDNLPYEIFKQSTSIYILCSLFNLFFQAGIMPSIWLKAIVKPLPKGSMTDARIPLQYRGICLLSTVNKLYTHVLNQRLSSFSEENGLFVEEQNGFRKGRSCEEHIFSLSNIIEHQLNQNQHAYVAFIDMEKAFDKVNRNLLLYRLMSLGIDGKMFNSIKALYSNNEYCMQLNNEFTDWFDVNIGVRQGDSMSSTLFALYINDLAVKIKELNMGISIGEVIISMLLFADDLVLIADSEENLQKMLDFTYEWCLKWRAKVNCNKTKVVDFKPKGEPTTSFRFKIGNNDIDIVQHYKYLGIIFDEYLHFDIASKTLAGAAGRALGKLWSIYKGFNGLGYSSYTKLYESYVDSVMLYSSGAWYLKEHSCCNVLQNRAIRGFLGVHRFAPNLAIHGDMGWYSMSIKRKVSIIRLWNRIITMSNDRLPKILLDYNHCNGKGKWCKNVKEIFTNTGNEQRYFDKYVGNISEIRSILFNIEKEKWSSEIQVKPKLRSYVNFKYDYGTETYVKSMLSKRRRSIMAQFRSGILPLKIETGRYTNTKIQDRLCDACDARELEDEFHFLIQCPLYAEEREVLYENAKLFYEDFDLIENDVKMTILLSDEDLCWSTAKYLSSAYQRRNLTLYN
jgi:hypothetical protein